MADLRFARRPAWLALHLLVLGIVAGMVALGFWQLDRLDQRRDRNALVEARAAADPAPVDDLVDPGSASEVVDEVRFRAVTATGVYAAAGTASVRMAQSGTSGGWVLSPLDLGDETVVVLRGFTGLAPDGSVPEPEPPAGDVEVEGVAVPVARLERVARTAVENLRAGDAGSLPVIVQLASSDPAEDPLLVPVPPPELDDGPHLSYAVQWFLFATVGAVGYPFFLRREARRHGRG
jgi:surfeit locus 1 family protein